MIAFFTKLSLFLITTTIACPDKDTYCGSCEGNSCIYCYDSYISPAGVCELPTTKIPNCLTYESSDKCRECVFGYYLNNNTCNKIEIDKCVRTAPKKPNECIICSDNILAINGVCNDNNKCTIDNCKYCTIDDDIELCAMCEKNYSAHVANDTAICKKDEENIKNCLTLNFDNDSRCLLCKAGYYSSDGTCLLSDDYTINQEGIDIFRLFGSILALLILFK